MVSLSGIFRGVVVNLIFRVVVGGFFKFGN